MSHCVLLNFIERVGGKRNKMQGLPSIYHFFAPILIISIKQEHKIHVRYEGCSNMNASSFITFVTYMLRQIVIPFWKELFVAFKMAPNIKIHSLYSSSYRHLYIKVIPLY